MQGRYRNGIPAEERKRVIGCGFSAAILVAPFLGLLFSVRIALMVLILALGTAAWFAYEASKEAVETTRTTLRALVVVNIVLLVISVAALLWL